MPGPIVLPAEFGPGVPLSARQLNDLQQEILRQLYGHTHHGDEQGPQLDTDAYQNRSVTKAKLADGAVDGRVIADGAIESDHLRQNSVTAEALANGSVDTGALQNGAVTEAKLSAAVQLLLRRTGDSASSASQVIWRDPIVVWAPEEEEEEVPAWIIDTFVDPELVYWKPYIIGIDVDNNPVQIDPRVTEMNGAQVLESYIIYDDKTPLAASDPVLAGSLGEAVLASSQEIEVVGAYEVTGGNFGDYGLGSLTAIGESYGSHYGSNTGATYTVGTGTGMMTGATMLHHMMGANPTAVSASGMPLAGAHAFGAGTSPPPSATPAMMRAAAGAGGGAAAPAAAMAAPAGNARSAAPAVASASGGGAKVTLTQSGQKAAARMTSIGSVDINGKPVPVGTEGSFTVSSAFAGKESFFEDEPLDFRKIGNQSDRKRAAEAGQIMLYNLGIDDAYVNSMKGKISDENFDLIMRAINADVEFYKPDNPMWGDRSWLPDILNRPDLFGSGYAISGGRNILDVTRQTTNFAGQGTAFVRVRFITPYQNSAYSVSVTPRTKSGFRLVSAHIRNKAPGYCDIHFVGQRTNGNFADINDLSFDLAVFGKLAG